MGPWPLQRRILGGAKPVKRGAKCMKWNKNVSNSVKSFQALIVTAGGITRGYISVLCCFYGNLTYFSVN